MQGEHIGTVPPECNPTIRPDSLYPDSAAVQLSAYSIYYCAAQALIAYRRDCPGLGWRDYRDFWRGQVAELMGRQQ